MASTGRLRHFALAATSAGQGGLIGRRPTLVALLIGILPLGATGVAQAAQPSVTIKPASSVGETTATLNGTVNPEGMDTKYHFELYDTEPEDKEPCETSFDTVEGLGEKGEELQLDAGSGKKAVNVSANVTGLAPGTHYCYTIVADRDELELEENGEPYIDPETGQYEEAGEEEVIESTKEGLTTVGKPPPPPPPVATTEGSREITLHTATVEGNVNSEGLDAHYYFEYGTSTSYGSDAPMPPGNDAGSGTNEVPVRVGISGLTADTLYHYRLVASNSTGTSYGDDRTFTTAEYEESEVASSRSAIRDPNTGDEWVFAATGSGAIDEWAWTPSGGWTQHSLTGGASIGQGTQPQVVRNPHTGFMAVYYTAQNGQIWNYNTNEAGGISGWSSYALSGGGALAATNTSPSVVFNPSNNFTAVYYVGPSGQLWNYNWTAETSWTAYALSGGGAAAAAGTSPSAIYNRSNSFTAVYYVGPSGQLWNYNWTAQTSWTAYALSGGGAAAAADTSPSVVYNAASAFTAVYYVGPSGQLWNYNWGALTSWTAYALSGGGAAAMEGTSPSVIYNPATAATNVYYVGMTAPILQFNWALQTSWTADALPDAYAYPITEAAEVYGETARLNGTVNPEKTETTYSFEYGTTTTYGTKAPVSPVSVGSGSSNVAVSQTIGELPPETTYHYRVVATNTAGTAYGEDHTFTSANLTTFSAPKYEAALGSKGSGGGQFVDPVGDALDSSGDVWVTDYSNKRVEEFSATGAFIRAIGWGVSNDEDEFEVCTSGCRAGIPGSGNGQFNKPWGIAINQSSGNVYVSDLANGRVEEFSSSGGFVRAFGGLGSGRGQFEAPHGSAIDSSGNVWVADFGNNRIDEFSATGEPMKAVGWGVSNGKAELEVCTASCEAGISGSGKGQFDQPGGIAISGGELYVTDWGNNRVEELSTSGAYLAQFGATGAGNGQFSGPNNIATEPGTGDLYVADKNNTRVEEFEPSGRFMGEFGYKGTGGGRFESNGPQDVAVSSSGAIYVTDTTNDRIQEWSTQPTRRDYIQTIDGGNSLNAVSCVPASIDCVVGDSKGEVFYATNVSTSASATWVSWKGPVKKAGEAVDCPSSSLCLLADGGNLYYATSLGGTWTEAYSPVNGVDAISCASSSFCIDGQNGAGDFRYATSPASTSWILEEQGSAAMNGVSCVSSSFCAIVSGVGDVYVADTTSQIESSSWTATDVDGSSALHGVACTSTTSCVAVDGAGNVIDLAISGTTVTASKHDIDGTNDLTAIACTGSSTCVAVDSAGSIFVSTNAGTSWSKEYATSTDLMSVSCASNSLCAAVDTTGKVTSFYP